MRSIVASLFFAISMGSAALVLLPRFRLHLLLECGLAVLAIGMLFSAMGIWTGDPCMPVALARRAFINSAGVALILCAIATGRVEPQEGTALRGRYEL